MTKETHHAKNGRLQSQVALVTGAGSVGPGWGNGRAIAVRFAQEGASIFAVDRDAERMLETVQMVKQAGGDIETATCDVTDSASVASMVATCQLERRQPARAHPRSRSHW